MTENSRREAPANVDTVRAIEWRDGELRLLDQRLLPGEERYLRLHDAASVAEAIRDLVVRGAPAIGITAAFGAVMAAIAGRETDATHWREAWEADLEILARARPTAVNLNWALDRMRRVADANPDDPVGALEAEAEGIRAADVAANHRMGELGAGLFGSATAVVTHCNTGSLATGGYGTALGVIRSAWARGLVTEVFAGETRPWLQGARLSAWELQRDGIPSRVIADAAAASLMRTGRIGWVITGADRVAANGDVANKIGTYALAVAARHHGIPFMVVAPVSTIDPGVPDGDAIPIEERDPAEVLGYGGRATAPPGARAWNPVFDITPAGLVSVLVTEAGVLEKPDEAGIRGLLERDKEAAGS